MFGSDDDDDDDETIQELKWTVKARYNAPPATRTVGMPTRRTPVTVDSHRRRFCCRFLLVRCGGGDSIVVVVVVVGIFAMVFRARTVVYLLLCDAWCLDAKELQRAVVWMRLCPCVVVLKDSVSKSRYVAIYVGM